MSQVDVLTYSQQNAISETINSNKQWTFKATYTVCSNYSLQRQRAAEVHPGPVLSGALSAERKPIAGSGGSRGACPGAEPLVRAPETERFLHLHNVRSWPLCPKIFLKNKKLSDVWGPRSPVLLDGRTRKFKLYEYLWPLI